MADILLAGLTLPDAYTRWDDELSWDPVGQDITVRVDGGQIIQEAVQSAGQPITLSTVLSRSMLKTLRTTFSSAEYTTTLRWRDGTTYTVAPNRQAGALDVKAVVPYADPADDDRYDVTIRLIEV